MGQQIENVKARAELVRCLPYLDYNYGRNHPLTIAAERGDLATFRQHSRHITQMMDIRVADLCDMATCALRAGGAA